MAETITGMPFPTVTWWLYDASVTPGLRELLSHFKSYNVMGVLHYVLSIYRKAEEGLE